MRLAVRWCIPEGPIASAIARAGEYLANASRAITCIGPVPSSSGQIPTHVSTQGRLAQHRGHAIDNFALGIYENLVAVGIHLRRVDRQHLLYNGRLDGWDSTLLIIVLFGSEVVSKRRPSLISAEWWHTRDIGESLRQLGVGHEVSAGERGIDTLRHGGAVHEQLNKGVQQRIVGER